MNVILVANAITLVASLATIWFSLSTIRSLRNVRRIREKAAADAERELREFTAALEKSRFFR